MDAEDVDPSRVWRDITPDAARRLVLAAVEAFAERGYHATTTRDIAGRAGMSPAALYIHYKTKEELLHHISRVGHMLTLDLLKDARDTAEAPAVRLAKAVHRFVRWHAEHNTMGRVVQYEIGALGPEHYAEIVGMRREIEGVLRSIITDGVHQGRFDVADVPGTTLALLSLCIDVARWFNPEGRRTPAELGDLYAALALRMVGAEAQVLR